MVTGAAGFIGSCLVGLLNSRGYENLILVDDFSRADKAPNLESKKWMVQIERAIFFDWLKENKPAVEFVFHIGARTDTTEFDYAVHQRLNVAYSQEIWQYCTVDSIPLVYASSAATYGDGELGYNDDHDCLFRCSPLIHMGYPRTNLINGLCNRQAAHHSGRG